MSNSCPGCLDSMSAQYVGCFVLAWQLVAHGMEWLLIQSIRMFSSLTIRISYVPFFYQLDVFERKCKQCNYFKKIS